MLYLALLSAAVFAQPGIQQISFGGPSNSYQFGVATNVGGPNPCPAIIECRTCTSAIGCVWSGTSCYQVVFQVTTCSSAGCATKPSQCPATASGTQCNSCTNSGCPTGQTCQSSNGDYCVGTCQVASTSCPYGAQWDAYNNKCVVTSCSAKNACPRGYTCNVNPCGYSPCPVVCTAPNSCNSCSSTSGCGQYQVCQAVPTPSTSTSTSNNYQYQNNCVGTCVDSPYSSNQACYAFTTCADCTGSASTNSGSGASCVWNGVQCYPITFVCRASGCVTQPGSCPLPCNQPTCDTCASTAGCVWGGSSCYASTTPCTGSNCISNPSQCQAATTCPSLSSCTACLTLPGCAWMGTYCVYSNVPCDGSTGCATTCDVQQPCTATDCTSCVSAANCRWTSSSRSCSYNPLPCTDSTCASTQSQCTTSQTCYGVTSCLACAQLTGCLWYGGTCFSVPCQGASCVALGYTSQCPQPVCQNVASCTDCTNTDGCMWNGQYCISSATGTCTSAGCAVNAAQCPSSGCAYGQVYSASTSTCIATSCNAANACPPTYTCNTQTGCGSALCPVVCTAPASQCPTNEQWTSCTSSTCFEATCSDNYATRVCAQDCRSGCQCVTGYARAPGGSCIPQGSCPSLWR